MKKIYINIKERSRKGLLLLLPVALLVGACGKDFLNYPSETSIPEEVTFATPERILAQVNGLYGSAKNGALFGGRYFIYNDIRSEEFANRTSNTVTGFTTWQFTNDPTDTYIANFWTIGYLTINRVNKFLTDFDSNPGVVSAELEASYRAEAKFVRALCYYALVQLFAKPYALNNGSSTGIPLRLQPETNSGNNELAPSTVAEIYAQILQDLNEAEAGLPVGYGTASLNTSRAHKNTAIALKTRIYLAMGRYADVITEANKIVSATAPFSSPNSTNVAHALQANVVNVFRTPYTTSENIFSFPMADTNAPGTQNQLGYYYNAGNIEYYLNRGAAGIFGNTTLWRSGDARRTGFTLAYNANWDILTKWSGAAPFIDWTPVLRYAEVLLNLAEAEAEVGDQTRAIALLSAVRSRSDNSYAFSGLTSRAAIVNSILVERRIEFLGEGFRVPDLQRRLSPIVSLGAGTSIPVTDDRYVFPIPAAEVLTNPGISQ
ncbi:RagB/SusD family nutrient uptake outer membrane protein [Sphingobacterium oryzagri]|uniref:RagB/SusD family nutrient uptake outer membrane protein n=1 Tax=Sphingobacterium oryzagri TaxID=3025669 RepID=A0ABY7WIE2_9SPHI|nr:RagB/SusD family nutrient uptake outer membrane protein [Sphingobacterium sp. KACC 22765]WDF69275.1 RagB/SusD family nutrient uptake outer membrane protein [Sphingobacterium sp. KACC 22765]